MKKSLFNTRQMVTMSVLAAIGAMLYILFGIPVFGTIYKLDFSNIPVLLAAFSMGPVPGLVTLLLKDIIHLLFKGIGSSAGIGDLADFITGAALILPASLYYLRNKTRRGAVIGMVLGTLCMTAVALAVNAWILFPFYMNAYHMDLLKIAGMLGMKESNGMLSILLATTLPFNLLKGVVLSVLTALIYKPLSPILHSYKGKRK